MRDSVDREGEFRRDRREARRQHAIICGMKISPRMVSAPSQNAITANASSAKRRAACGPSAASSAGERRDEGGVERALAEQAAEQVGQLQGDEEGVGDRAGAEHRRDQHVAREAEDAAGHGPAADGQDVTEHRRCAAPAAARQSADFGDLVLLARP